MTGRSTEFTDARNKQFFESGPPDVNIPGSYPISLKSRPYSTRSRHAGRTDWREDDNQDEPIPRRGLRYVRSLQLLGAPSAAMALEKTATPSGPAKARLKTRSVSTLSLFISFLGISILVAILKSLTSHQDEPNRCRMSYMRPSYLHFSGFDTEHTRFATKYSLYLYREQGIDDENKVGLPLAHAPIRFRHEAQSGVY